MKGITLKLSDMELVFIEEATEALLPHIPNGEKPFYLLLLNKLSEEEITVDGMYLRCIENALTTKAERCSRTRVKNYCLGLSESIRKKREKFQNASINLGA